MWRQVGTSLFVISALWSVPVRCEQQGAWSGLVSDTKDGKKAHASACPVCFPW